MHACACVCVCVHYHVSSEVLEENEELRGRIKKLEEGKSLLLDKLQNSQVRVEMPFNFNIRYTIITCI